MRVHYLQHVVFEGPASIERWAISRGHTLTATKYYENDVLPTLEPIDCLIILGGPMNVYEDGRYPWLKQEKAFIRCAIELDKAVLGICLGAQLIADALGAKVYRGEYKEIGWFPIYFTPAARQAEIFDFLPEQMHVFHWHGDTWRHPEQAVHLARSAGCANQAFLYKRRVIGLQFHLESTRESVQQLVQHCGDELVRDKYVQGAAEILSAEDDNFEQINEAMFGLIDRLSKQCA